MPFAQPLDAAVGPSTPLKAPVAMGVATPGSQVSTAPPTPLQTWSLPETQHDLTCDLPFKRLHSAGSSTIAPEDPGKECNTSTDEAEEDMDEDSSTENAEEIDPTSVRSVGLPPLQSELGRWAQRTVEAEEWLEERLSTKFAVDNSELKALTVGVAFRLSKKVNHCDRSVDGPYWGSSVTGVDLGDGWVKVGRRYLPTHLEGKRILVPAAAFDEVIPACSLDGDGVVHRFCPSGQPISEAGRLKRFFRRRALRRIPGYDDEPVLCPDESGKVSIYLYLDSNTARLERMRRRRAALRRQQGAESPFGVLSTDAEGIVQDWL